MKIKFPFFVLISIFMAGDSGAQTRFHIPDTIPNYSSYRYVDECLAAVARLTNEVRAKDTVRIAYEKLDSNASIKSVSHETVVQHGKACLADVNIDTVPVNSRELNVWIRVLLLVGRDADVERIFARALDSVHSQKEWNEIYMFAVNMYSNAKPVRLESLKRLLEINRPDETHDERNSRHFMTEIEIAIASLSIGESVLPRQIVDSIVKNARAGVFKNQSFGPGSFLRIKVYPLVFDVLFDQGMDCLKVSTAAYREFLENIWFQFTDLPFSESHEAIGEIAPSIGGEYWYRNEWYTEEDGRIVFSSKAKKIDKQVVPVPGKVNALLFLQGSCHVSTNQFGGQYGRFGGIGFCWRDAAMIKRLKQEFPHLEVTVVSRTFGSFGGGMPIPAAQEADQLSDYLLGFYEIPAIHAISETEYIRMSGYDRRRLDLDVAFQHDYNNIRYNTNIILVDEKGKVFHNTITSLADIKDDRHELILRKKLRTVFSRLAQ